MSLFVLEIILWIAGIRGHIPQSDGFPIGRSGPSFGTGTGTPMAALAVAAAVVAGLALVLWAVVWLAIKVL